MSKEITIDDLLKLEKKLWATTLDIQRIGCVGYNKALKIKNEIRNQLIDEGWTLPRNAVPMEYVIKQFPSMMKRLEANGGVTYAR